MQCFIRLGLQPESGTLSSIRKAFRRLARQTHPDRVPLEQRDQAKVAFQVLHEDYQKAMEYVKSRDASTGGPSTRTRSRSRQNQSQSTSKSLRDMCRNISTEIATDNDKEFRSRVDAMYEKIVQMRDDTDACWTFMRNAMLGWHYEVFGRLENDGYATLASSLRVKCEEWNQEIQQTEARNVASLAQFVQDHWPDKRRIQEHLCRNLIVLRCHAVVQLLSDPAIRDFCVSCSQSQCDPTPRLKRIAEQIGQTFPNRKGIKALLSQVLTLEHETLFGYLRPEHLELCTEIFRSLEGRLALTGTMDRP